MKIAFVSRVSFADNDLPIIKEMQKQGHEVYYFMELPCYQLKSTIINISHQLPYSGILHFSKYPELNMFSRYVDCTNFYIINRVDSHSLSRKTFGVYFQLFHFLNKINPDVVHTSSHYLIYNFILYKFRKKSVLTVHDPFLHSGESSFCLKIYRKLAFTLFPKFVVLNETQKDSFIKVNRLRASQVLVNRISAFDFYPSFLTSPVKKESHTLLFFGRISPYKGLEYLCKAFPIIKKRLPDCKLVIAGGGKMYFDITPYKCMNGVEVYNRYVSASELSTFLQQASICVCPYTDATQSGVITTCYSMGVPVVASNVGGLSTMVQEGKSGCLVEPRNVEALANTIISLLTNPKTLDDMRNYLLDSYFTDERSTSVIVSKYIEFYKQ